MSLADKEVIQCLTLLIRPRTVVSHGKLRIAQTLLEGHAPNWSPASHHDAIGDL